MNAIQERKEVERYVKVVMEKDAAGQNDTLEFWRRKAKTLRSDMAELLIALDAYNMIVEMLGNAIRQARESVK
jgi:hypothetical protein